MTPSLHAPPPSRSPWQRLYGAVLARRRRTARAARLPRPTWSVGNLHWGGGGKTPLVAAIARTLLERGIKVCVLSRGYGREGSAPRIVSEGSGPTCDVLHAGDEPHLLARTVAGLAVAVAAARFDAGQLALRSGIAPDLFLLDDGFSHVRLARDLDVLAFPASDPFGGGRLPPSGRLREPLDAARHAAAVVLTGADEAPVGGPDLGAALANALRPFGFEGSGFATHLRAEIAVADGQATPESVVLVSGVARPDGVEETARRCGARVAEHLRFPDHHPYPERSLRRIDDALARHSGARLLATSKDWGKLCHRFADGMAELRIESVLPPAMTEWLAARAREATMPRQQP